MKHLLNIMLGQKLLMVLTLAVMFVWFCGDMPSTTTKSLLYTCSIAVKNLVTFTIPVLIIIFISNSLAAISGRAFYIVAVLFALVFLSNYIAIIYSFGFYKAFVGNLAHNAFVANSTVEILKPLWDIPQIKLLKNDTALLAGLGLGIYASYSNNHSLKSCLVKLQRIANKFLQYVILPLLPVFVLGSLIKLKHENTFGYIISTYDTVFLYFFAAQFAYVLFLYMLAAGFNYRTFARYIKNMMPAYITGLSTLSSAATMPVTIAATIKNTGSEKIAHTVIPATVNIHLLGTAVGTNILVLSTFAIFNHPAQPGFMDYIIYALYFAIAQFAVVGVSGGSVFATMPIIEAHLGATPEMLALMSMMVIMFDPIDTSFNISANGAFAVIFKKLMGKEKFAAATAPHSLTH